MLEQRLELSYVGMWTCYLDVIKTQGIVCASKGEPLEWEKQVVLSDQNKEFLLTTTTQPTHPRRC